MYTEPDPGRDSAYADKKPKTVAHMVVAQAPLAIVATAGAHNGEYTRICADQEKAIRLSYAHQCQEAKENEVNSLTSQPQMGGADQSEDNRHPILL